MDKKKPKTIKVAVYSCRNLKPKKGNGDPLAWVIFGFGKDKCCTSQIRDKNAKWNEESTFTVNDPKLPLKLNIKDKDDIIGQIVIPFADIPRDEHFLKWVPVGPHKKNLKPQGEICLDCWKEGLSDSDEEPENEKQGKKVGFFNKIGLNKPASPKNSPNGRRFSEGLTSIKGSVSVQDLSKKEPKNTDLLPPAAYANVSGNRRLSNSNSHNSALAVVAAGVDNRRSSIGDYSTLPTIKEQNYPPKIQNIIPTSGPTKGGTLIQITGKYLGSSKEDITRLMVAGCNCLSTVEYYSPNKIMCTTSESEGKGPISLSTKTGGMSSSKVMFEFVEKVAEETKNDAEDSATGRDSGCSSGIPEADMDKDELIEKLRGDIDELKFDNRELREYVDKLVLYLMDKYPDALESSKMYYR